MLDEITLTDVRSLELEPVNNTHGKPRRSLIVEHDGVGPLYFTLNLVGVMHNALDLPVEGLVQALHDAKEALEDAACALAAANQNEAAQAADTAIDDADKALREAAG